MHEFSQEFSLDDVDLSAYLHPNPRTEPFTVRYTPWKKTGWRKWLARLTFRPTESETYEFEAVEKPAQPFLPSQDEDVTGFSFSFQAISPIRVVSKEETRSEDSNA